MKEISWYGRKKKEKSNHWKQDTVCHRWCAPKNRYRTKTGKQCTRFLPLNTKTQKYPVKPRWYELSGSESLEWSLSPTQDITKFVRSCVLCSRAHHYLWVKGRFKTSFGLTGRSEWKSSKTISAKNETPAHPFHFSSWPQREETWTQSPYHKFLKQEVQRETKDKAEENAVESPRVNTHHP